MTRRGPASVARRHVQSRRLDRGSPRLVCVRRLRRHEARDCVNSACEHWRTHPLSWAAFLDEEQAFPRSYWQAIADDTQAGDRRISLIAEQGDELVGMVGGVFDDRLARVHLVALWVEPSVRGRGVGRMLVQGVVMWARELDADRVELWVVDGAPSAAALYESCGFGETEISQPIPHHPARMEKLLVRRDLTGRRDNHDPANGE
jgi:GNAT superfamily N-acetyltransferase